MQQGLTAGGGMLSVVSLAARLAFASGTRLAACLACIMTLALLGCASPPPPPPPTIVELSIEPAGELNPDPSGRASPVLVRIYHLASEATFSAADFFALYEDHAGTLGADLLGSEEIMVRPGEIQTMIRELKPDARFIGIAAFYRDYDGATWRAVAPVPPNETTKLSASLGARSVALEPGAW